MPLRDLHGLVVETRCEAGEDPAELLLGLLPEAAPGSRPDLVLETVIVPDEGALVAGGAVAFTYHDVVLRVAGSEVTVEYPGAVVRLPPFPGPLRRGGRAENHEPPEVAGPGVMRVLLRAPLRREDAWTFAQVPLLVSLLAALRPRGLHHLHAGAVVAADGRALVVAGQSQSGKSTLTAALVAAGCGYLGDDVVLVGRTPAVRPSTTRPHEHRGQSVSGRYAQDERSQKGERTSAEGRPPGEPRLLSFPRAFHLSERSILAIAGAAEQPTERTTTLGRRALDPRRLFPGRERREAPAPAAIVFPRVVDRADTVLQPLPGAEALGRLVESSALVAVKAIPGAREQVALLGQLVDGARAFEAELGRDLLEDAARTAGRLLGEALP